MFGLVGLASHLVVIVAIWVAVLLIVRILRRTYVKSADEIMKGEGEDSVQTRKEAREMWDKIVRVTTIIANAAVVIAIILSVLFQWNWADTGTPGSSITPAHSSDLPLPPTVEDIKALNEESPDVVKKEKVEEKAKVENDKAISDATELFQKAAKAAEK